MNRFAILLGNLVWMLACLPGTVAFLVALWWPRSFQQRALRRMLRRARITRFGRQNGLGTAINAEKNFTRLPLSDYESLRPFVDAIALGDPHVLTPEPVQVLQPTSGSTAAPKLIPFTRGLRRQFQAALSPWLFSLYVLRPGLLFGRQYWCLSPNTRPRDAARTAVPVGFADDLEYLGGWQRRVARLIFVAPPELARIEDPNTFEFLTLLVMVREENLRLISVWHPSFLTLLVEALPRHGALLEQCIRTGSLPPDLKLPAALRDRLAAHCRANVKRARTLARLDLGDPNQIRRLWPGLQVISCWTGDAAEPWLARLRTWFPRAVIQGKGLLATEGVVTIPWGLRGRCVSAVRSHFLEFIEPESAAVKRCWELEPERTYSVALTTAGGLWRYRLGDSVRVRGFVGGTPCLEFIRREGLVSDLCGEKLSLADAEAALGCLQTATGMRFQFAMLAPDSSPNQLGYVLFFEPPSCAMPPDPTTFVDVVEEALQRNFHYRHARRLGQLHPVRLQAVIDGAGQYRRHLLKQGARHGDIKFLPLRPGTNWARVFAKSVERMSPGCSSLVRQSPLLRPSLNR